MKPKNTTGVQFFDVPQGGTYNQTAPGYSENVMPTWGSIPSSTPPTAGIQPTMGATLGAAPASPTIGGEGGVIGSGSVKGKEISNDSSFVNLQDYINSNKDQANKRVGSIYSQLNDFIPQDVDMSGSNADDARNVLSGLMNVQGLGSLANEQGNSGKSTSNWIGALTDRYSPTSKSNTLDAGIFSNVGENESRNEFNTNYNEEEKRLRGIYDTSAKAANQDTGKAYGDAMRNYFNNQNSSQSQYNYDQGLSKATQDALANWNTVGFNTFMNNQESATKAHSGNTGPTPVAPGREPGAPVVTPLPNTGTTETIPGGRSTSSLPTGGVTNTPPTTGNTPIAPWLTTLINTAVPGGSIFTGIYNANNGITTSPVGQLYQYIKNKNNAVVQ